MELSRCSVIFGWKQLQRVNLQEFNLNMNIQYQTKLANPTLQINI